MPDPRPNPPPPAGDPLPATDADLTRRSRVDAADIRRARERWPSVAPDGWQGLIEATVEPEEKTT